MPTTMVAMIPILSPMMALAIAPAIRPTRIQPRKPTVNTAFHIWDTPKVRAPSIYEPTANLRNSEETAAITP